MGSSSQSHINTFTVIPSRSLQTQLQDLAYVSPALRTKCCLPKAAKPLHHPLTASTTAISGYPTETGWRAHMSDYLFKNTSQKIRVNSLTSTNAHGPSTPWRQPRVSSVMCQKQTLHQSCAVRAHTCRNSISWAFLPTLLPTYTGLAAGTLVSWTHG